MNSKPFLLLINGTAGVGKTTLAKKIHETYEMSYFMHLDTMKKQFSHFRNHIRESIDRNIQIASITAEYLLSKQYPVIVEKMLWGTQGNIEDLNTVAKKLNVPFIEIVLTAEKEIVLSRANERGYPLEREGGLSYEKVDRFYDQTKVDIDIRQPEHIIDTSDLSPDEVFIQVKKIIDSNIN